MYKNVVLGMTLFCLAVFFVLALTGGTVSAWWVVLWIIPTLLDQLASRLYEMT